MTTDKKKPPGRWKPGTSGNPKGRTPGTGEVAAIRAAIADRVPDLLAAMMTRALDGDVGACRLLLERAISPLKASEQAQAIHLPDGSLTDQGRAVLAAVAAAEIGPSAGAALLGAIGTLAKVTELDEWEKRLSALEQRDAKH